MKKVIAILWLSVFFTDLFCQEKAKFTFHSFVNYNYTLHDATIINNPGGVGIGIQMFYNNKTKFKPQTEFSENIYLGGSKILRVDPNGNAYESVEEMLNFFLGASYHPKEDIFFSFLAGPSYINEKALFGIKPSVGVYFTKRKRLFANVAYINVFNRGNIEKQSFGSLSISIGVKFNDNRR